jgi:hypothetical protein
MCSVGIYVYKELIYRFGEDRRPKIAWNYRPTAESKKKINGRRIFTPEFFKLPNL